MAIFPIVGLTAIIFIAFTHCRTVTKAYSSLSKRTVEFDGSCNNYPQIAQGLTDANNLARNAATVLNDINNPFVDQHPWDPLRQTLFGSETLSSNQAIIGEHALLNYRSACIGLGVVS